MARRTREEWRELVDRQTRSGRSISEFCRRESLTENSFYRWRRIFAEEAEPRFIPVSIVERADVEIQFPCGAKVKVAANRDSLREVFAALLSIEVDDA